MGGSAKRPRSSRTSDMIGHHSAGVAQSGKSCILDDRARRRLKTELYGQSSADADRRPGGSRPVRMLSRGLSGSNSACSSRANTPDIDLDTDKDKEVFRVNHFARVPEEIIVRIMRLLGPGDLLRTAQVCRQWRRIAHDRAPWQRLVLGKWPLCSPEMYSGDWRRMFLDGNSLGGRADLTWRVEKFRELSVKSLYSHSVVAGGFPWRLFLFPRGNNVENMLSLYLDVANADTLPEGWRQDARFHLRVVNHRNPAASVRRDVPSHVFVASERDWGFTNFMSLDTINSDPEAWLDKGALVIETSVETLPTALQGGEDRFDCMRVQFAVMSEGDFGGHHGYELFDFSDMPSQKMLWDDTLEPFKAIAHRRYGIPPEEQQYWTCCMRTNRTVRVFKRVTPAAERIPLLSLFTEVERKKLKVKLLFLRRVPPESNENGTCDYACFEDLPPDDDEARYGPLAGVARMFEGAEREQCLIFFKYYDPIAEKMSYVGQILADSNMPLQQMFPAMRRMAGLPKDYPLLVFEEVKPGMVDLLDAKNTLETSHLINGDIVCFQPAPEVLGIPSSALTVDVYLARLLEKVSVLFERSPAQKESCPPPHTLRVTLNRTDTMFDAAQALATRLGLPLGCVRLEAMGRESSPWVRPVRYSMGMTLSAVFGYSTGSSLPAHKLKEGFWEHPTLTALIRFETVTPPPSCEPYERIEMYSLFGEE